MPVDRLKAVKLLAILLSGLQALAAAHAPDGTAAGMAQALQESGLDPEECYKVRDIAFQKEDLRFYLTEGHLIFSRPVAGRRVAAVFTTDVPGGDGEVIIFPPHKSERLSLARFAKAPNLNEHITTAVLLFTDDTAEKLMRGIQSGVPRKAPEAGLLLAQNFGSVVRNLASSYEVRLVQDLLAPDHPSAGVLYAAVAGRKLGNFDLIYDPRSREQIFLGQVVYRNERPYFDTWASFPARSFRVGEPRPGDDGIDVGQIQIEATLNPDLNLKAITRLQVSVSKPAPRVIDFEVSNRMRITEVRVNGQPAEVFAREALRSGLLRGNNNELFLVVLPEALEPGRKYVFEFHHEGAVVSDSGNGVYFVGSRGNWYPKRETGFAKHDLTFRYPRNLDLVSTGEVVESRTEGEWQITRRTTASPVRFAGFNLGTYEKASASRAGLTVEVVANRSVESALQTRPREIIVLPPPSPRARRGPEALPIPVALPPPNPLARLRELAVEVGSAMEFLAQHLGPPPLKTLTVSPIPGTFGQGFPGLVYLSTLAYLKPADRPAGARTQQNQLFFSELLHAHEAAHQWWGNLVTPASYRDDWIMEALSSYSALLVLERKKGRKALEAVLDGYRDHLLQEGAGGDTIESAGPIVWGLRLHSSQTPGAWRAILYEKGSWIVHMLRMRMGDEVFLKMLGELVRRNRFQSVSTDDFRQLAAEFLPRGADDPQLENFFEQWVYGTGVPTLKMDYKLQGKAPKMLIRGTIAQSGVDEDFTALVPVEVQLPRKKNIVKWVRTSSEGAAFTVEIPVAALRVSLDPSRAVLASHR
jgi:hypothetical protein